MSIITNTVYNTLKAHAALEKVCENNKDKIPFQTQYIIKKLSNEMNLIGELASELSEQNNEHTEKILSEIVEIEDYDLTLSRLLCGDNISIDMQDLQDLSYFLRPA